MTQTNLEFEEARHEALDRFFASYPNAPIEQRVAHVLPILSACSKAMKGKPQEWAAGIVYAVSSIGVGVPGVSNQELEAVFGVKMNSVRKRAAKVKAILGDDRPLPPCYGNFLNSRAEFTIRDEANAICAYAFRNGPIEDIHADGRISQAEMKQLMVHASESLARLMARKLASSEEYDRFIRDYGRKFCWNWDR